MNKSKRKYPRVYAKNDLPSMTKQSFKEECNINNIMARFQKTGALTHYAKHAPTYGDCTPVQLQDALQVVADAEERFAELPSSIRKKFHNNPEEFLEFVQDEKNLEEMRELGLADKAKPSSLGQPATAAEKQSEPAPASTEPEKKKD